MKDVLLRECLLGLCHMLDVSVHFIKLQEHSLFEFQELLCHTLLLVRQLLGYLIHAIPDEGKRFLNNDRLQIVNLNTMCFCQLLCIFVEHFV